MGDIAANDARYGALPRAERAASANNRACCGQTLGGMGPAVTERRMGRRGWARGPDRTAGRRERDRGAARGIGASYAGEARATALLRVGSLTGMRFGGARTGAGR